MKKDKKVLKDDDIESPYCDTCGGCGFTGCCGIESFLKYHVQGKTNCKNEAMFIEDIIAEFKNDD